MLQKSKYCLQLIGVFCSLTLTGLSLVFAMFVAVSMFLRTQTYVYLTVLMPSGEGVSLLIMLICGALTGAVATSSLLKGTTPRWAIADSLLKIILSTFITLSFKEINVLCLLIIFSAIYLLTSICLILVATFENKTEKQEKQ